MRNFTFGKSLSRCRSLFIAALAGISLTASAQSVRVFEKINTDDGYSYEFMSKAISPNKRYIAGCVLDYINMSYGVMIYDLQTDTYSITPDVDYMGSSLNAINDEGVAVGYNGPAVKYSISGEATNLDTPEGYGTKAMAMSDDASVVAGEYYSLNDWQAHACVWVDDKMTPLPEPTAEEAGIDFIGSEAFYINSDGSLIVGILVDDFSTGVFVAWRLQEDGSYVCDLIYKDYYDPNGTDPDRPYIQFTPTGLSRNGKYVAMKVGQLNTVQYMARYDMETGELKTFVPDGSGSIPTGTVIEPSGVSNDGSVLCTIMFGSVWAQEMNGGIWYDGAEYPVIISSLSPELRDLAELDSYGGNQPTCITPDGTGITGYAYNSSFEYIAYAVDLDGTSTGITKAETKVDNSAEVARYTLDGRLVSAPVKGVNIIKRADGSTTKVIVK